MPTRRAVVAPDARLPVAAPVGGGHEQNARAVLDSAMSEAEFMAAVIQLAEHHHYNVYHTRNSKGSNKGYPDLCCLRFSSDGTGRLVYLELKSMKGRATVEQRMWIIGLSQVPGVVAMIARPCDWDAIETALKGER